MKQKQQFYYNQHTKELKDKRSGEAVQMRLPGETTWSSGECIQLVGPRSYKVRVGNTEYIRNRRQLIPTGKPLESNELPEIVDQSIEQRDNESEDMATSQPPEPATVSPPRTPVLRRSERGSPSSIMDERLCAI